MLEGSKEHRGKKVEKQPCQHQDGRTRRERKCTRCWSRDFPGGDIHPVSCGGDHAGADIDPTAPHAGAGGCLLKEAGFHREPMLRQVYPGGLQHVEGPCAGAVYEGALTLTRAYWSRGRVWGRRSGREDLLRIDSIKGVRSPLPYASVGGRGRGIGMKLNFEKGEGSFN